MRIRNVKIEEVNISEFRLYGDTKKFGTNQILFVGISHKECLDYLKKHEVLLPYGIKI